MIFVFSGTYHQAKEWASNKKLKIGEWRFISSVFTLKGVRNCKYVKTGTYTCRNDFLEIQNEIILLENLKRIESTDE